MSAQTYASDDPVLPPVYSTTVCFGRSLPSRSAPLDHRERHLVLVRPRRIRRLELDPDLGHAGLDETLDADDWRRADRAEHPRSIYSPNGLIVREPVETTTLFVSK